MPSFPVVVLRTWPLSILVAVTVTFATKDPDGSVTLPVNAPIAAVCASRDGVKATNRKAKRTPGKTTLCWLREIFLNIVHLTPNLIVRPKQREEQNNCKCSVELFA